MFLTRENYELILKYLYNHGIKDVDFPEILGADVDPEDIITIVHLYGNRKITLLELKNAISNLIVYKDGDVVIEDSLTSTNTEAALSANKGRELNELIEKLYEEGLGIDGVSTYTTSMIEKHTSTNTLPEEYIDIGNPTLSGYPVNNTIKVLDGGDYLSIIMKSLRALLYEVSKIKNTYKYGLLSYNGKNTAMSVIGYGYDDEKVVEDEPLWAIEPSDMSKLGELSITGACELSPSEESTITSPKDGVVNITGTATWTLSSISEMEDLSKNTDAKIALYLNTKSANENEELDVDIQLHSEDNSGNILFNLKDFIQTYAQYYNSLIVINRKLTVDSIQYGTQYIWISIKNRLTGNAIAEGYWDGTNTLKNTLPNYISKNYYFENISLTDMSIYLMEFYSKYLDFSNEVSTTPYTSDDYKYKVAHIAIRSVDTIDTAKNIINQLMENELIYAEDTGMLYIKNNYSLKAISSKGTQTNDDTMTDQQIIQSLINSGIITCTSTTDESGNTIYNYENVNLNPIDSITFTHEATNTKYAYSIDSNGDLKGNRLPTETLEEQLSDNGINVDTATSGRRGFVGHLRYKEVTDVTSADQDTDFSLKADRIKIGAVYAPHPNVSVHGCSHAYIELENTSDEDFPLEGCYLHFITGISTTTVSGGLDNLNFYHLALTGILPKGGTYLIRGKLYAEYDLANTFIKVKTFDQEWYNGSSLIDLTTSTNNCFVLTYGYPKLGEEDGYHNPLITASGVELLSSDSGPYKYNPRYIDSINIGAAVSVNNTSTNQLVFAGASGSVNKGLLVYTYPTTGTSTSCIYKNMFELDPAKQAFQGLNTKDSSRIRNSNIADMQTLLLNKEYIEFPKTSEKFPISNFTPKASYENKNISTDKTKLDLEKPNAVTCSFGINIHTTRCFNWVSGGAFDEYIWIRKKVTSGTANAWTKFESYNINTVKSASTLPANTTTTVYTEGTSTTYSRPTTGGFARIEFYTGTRLYDKAVTSSGKTTTTTTTEYIDPDGIYPSIYNRITHKFPGSNTLYTAHKCILFIQPESSTDTNIYEYIVGRADINGNPDAEHTSDIQTFTIYPITYTPRVYQTTDQQGFHWVEYQVWAAAALIINDKINTDIAKDGNIIPIVVNTGDMTQSGCRMNEWLDYYNGSKVLADHLEQMYVVGNNDLCMSADAADGTPAVEILGTGDDKGKSNSFYFHVFYCYEIDTNATNTIDSQTHSVLPIINNKYVPSIYHFGTSKYDFLMMNSEITEENCKSWYNLISEDATVNAYTGYSINGTSSEYKALELDFNPIYEIVYSYLKQASDDNKTIMAFCHEMPFTVITEDNLNYQAANMDRSCNAKSNYTGVAASTVGSHLNIMNATKDTKGIYWFSRLLEFFGVKICIGGHKHTYAITNTLCENYLYENGTKDSITDGAMTMPTTLRDDTAIWNRTLADGTLTANNGTTKITSINTTKFPIVIDSNASTEGYVSATATTVEPRYTLKTAPTNSHPVVYFMCLATGFKLFSNKELPSLNQTFAKLIPAQTAKTSTAAASADKALRWPMFAVFKLTDQTVAEGSSRAANKDTITSYIARIKNITSGATNLYRQDLYSTSDANLEWLLSSDMVTIGSSTDNVYPAGTLKNSSTTVKVLSQNDTNTIATMPIYGRYIADTSTVSNQNPVINNL